MKKTSKIISVLLIAAMMLSVIGIVPISAAQTEIADTGATSGTTGDCTWTLDDNGVLTISGNGKMEDYLWVTPWGTSVTSVIIENGVTRIGRDAFSGCTSLTSVTLPNSVISIGQYAFSQTKWYNNQPAGLVYAGKVAYTMKDSWSAVVHIKDGTVGIADFAFYGCSKLTSITIPDSVTSIGNSAFSSCTGLTSIDIPDSVTQIGNSAFSSCTELTSIDIPDSVTIIGDSAFRLCESLTSMTIPDSVTSISSSMFRHCRNLTSVNIPDSIISIGSEAFFNCDSLISVSIPNSVMSIDRSLFFSCDRLINITVSDNNSVYDSRNNCNAIIETETNTLLVGCINTVIPDSVTSIGDKAFYICRNLTSVNIPDSVISIGSEAFRDCYSLSSVRIPDSVTSIGNSAFNHCGLTSVSIGNSVMSIGSAAFCNCGILTSISIPDSVTSIGEYAFDGTAWLNNQPDGLVYAGKVAYKMKGECPEVVQIKDGTTEIVGFAFSGYSSLTSVTIPDSVTSIGDEAFYNCNNLTSVIIPSSVVSIGDKAIGIYFSVPFNRDKKIDNFTIYGYTGSEAERYANKNEFNFISIGIAPKPGDADGDGVITPMDVTEVQFYLSNMATQADQETLMFADVDKNRRLEVIDTTWLQRYLAEMPIPYEIG